MRLIISRIHRTRQWASCAEGEFEGHISCRLKVNIVQWPFRAGPLRPSNLNVEHRLSAWVAREPRWLRHIAAAFTLPARREGRRVVVPHCLPEQITSPSQISVQGRLFTDRAGHSVFLIRPYVQSRAEHPTLLSVVSHSDVNVSLLLFFLISTLCRHARVKTSDLFERWRNLQVCRWEQNKEETSNFK